MLQLSLGSTSRDRERCEHTEHERKEKKSSKSTSQQVGLNQGIPLASPSILETLSHGILSRSKRRKKRTKRNKKKKILQSSKNSSQQAHKGVEEPTKRFLMTSPSLSLKKVKIIFLWSQNRFGLFEFEGVERLRGMMSEARGERPVVLCDLPC